MRGTALVLAGLMTAVGASLVAPRELAANTRVDIRLLRAFGFAPADVEVCVIIQPDDDNRAMTVTVESKTFLRESTVQLEGNTAPRINDFRFRALPAGSYEVRVQLFDSQQRPRGWTRRFFSLS